MSLQWAILWTTLWDGRRNAHPLDDPLERDEWRGLVPLVEWWARRSAARRR